MPTEKRKIGDIGEAVAARFLTGRGFTVVERNYLKKWGEIDIIAKKKDTLHFIEVKTQKGDVSREIRGYRPEDKIHPDKLERFGRAIQSYIADHRIKIAKPDAKPKHGEVHIQVDVIAVVLDRGMEQAKVRMLESVALESAIKDFWW